MKLVETSARPFGDLLHKESMFTSITPAMLQVHSGLFLHKTGFHLKRAYSGFVVEISDNDTVLPSFTPVSPLSIIPHNSPY